MDNYPGATKSQIDRAKAETKKMLKKQPKLLQEVYGAIPLEVKLLPYIDDVFWKCSDYAHEKLDNLVLEQKQVLTPEEQSRKKFQIWLYSLESFVLKKIASDFVFVGRSVRTATVDVSFSYFEVTLLPHYLLYVNNAFSAALEDTKKNKQVVDYQKKIIKVSNYLKDLFVGGNGLNIVDDEIVLFYLIREQYLLESTGKSLPLINELKNKYGAYIADVQQALKKVAK